MKKPWSRWSKLFSLNGSSKGGANSTDCGTRSNQSLRLQQESDWIKLTDEVEIRYEREIEAFYLWIAYEERYVVPSVLLRNTSENMLARMDLSLAVYSPKEKAECQEHILLTDMEPHQIYAFRFHQIPTSLLTRQLSARISTVDINGLFKCKNLLTQLRSCL